jgi:hypothetical protein
MLGGSNIWKEKGSLTKKRRLTDAKRRFALKRL